MHWGKRRNRVNNRMKDRCTSIMQGNVNAEQKFTVCYLQNGKVYAHSVKEEISLKIYWCYSSSTPENSVFSVSSKWQKYKLVITDLTIRNLAYLKDFFRISFHHFFSLYKNSKLKPIISSCRNYPSTKILY